MTTFIKAKLKKSDGPTNVNKYRVAELKYYKIWTYLLEYRDALLIA